MNLYLHDVLKKAFCGDKKSSLTEYLAEVSIGGLLSLRIYCKDYWVISLKLKVER